MPVGPTDRLHEPADVRTRPPAEVAEVADEAEAEATQAEYHASGGATRLGPGSGPDEVLRMQRMLGNQFVQRAIAGERESGGLVGASQSDMVAEVRQRSGGGMPL